VDPRSQSEDLGNDATYASTLGLANLKRIVPNLLTWGTVPGEDYETVEELYGNVVGQWNRYLGHVTRQVGGVMIDPKMVGQEGPVYTPFPAERQRGAVAFLLAEGFADPTWLLDADILRRVEPAGVADRVQRLQEGALSLLLQPMRISRLLEAEQLDGDAAYQASELFSAVRTGLWAEIARGSAITPSRRGLQRAHVDRLAALLTDDATATPPVAFQTAAYGYRAQAGNRSDIRPLARGELLALQADLGRALARYPATTRRAERLHLIDMQARIEDILDPRD
jgi:hypothetical protein